MGKAAALKEIARECSFLHDRDSFTEKILKRTTALFSADAIAVGNKKGLGFDTTFISHGYPAEYIINYCNLNHERRRSLLELYGSGPQRGYFSISASGFKLKEKYPDDYKARYVKHDIKDIVQTSFFDAKHELMGATGILTRSKDAFNEDETAAMDTITPHIYHAFRNYRRIVEAEILTTDSLDELLYGIVTTDTLGVVTYINAAARYITSLDTNDKIPGYLKKAADKLKADFTFTGDVNLSFREITSHSPAGDILCMNLDGQASKYLPVEGAGRLFIIDPSTINQKTLDSLSEREKEVLRFIVRGVKDKNIAEELHISEHTVHSHIKNILEKLDAKNRTDATGKALALGFE